MGVCANANPGPAQKEDILTFENIRETTQSELHEPARYHLCKCYECKFRLFRGEATPKQQYVEEDLRAKIQELEGKVAAETAALDAAKAALEASIAGAQEPSGPPPAL